ncbi:MAG: hypothetical protein ACFE9R_21490, partial [Candidatus Hermodarchaeota archaeon]
FLMLITIYFKKSSKSNKIKTFYQKMIEQNHNNQKLEINLRRNKYKTHMTFFYLNNVGFLRCSVR